MSDTMRGDAYDLMRDAQEDASAETERLRTRISELEKQRDDLQRCNTAETERRRVAETALAKINAIRDSIVGLQLVNWSEHIYPLVAALNEAGLKGLPYPEAKCKYGTMLERTAEAERKLAACEVRVKDMEAQRAVEERYVRKET